MLGNRQGAYRSIHRQQKKSPRRYEVSLFAFVFLSLVLLVLSRLQNPVLNNARMLFSDLIAPALEVAAIPAGETRRIVNRVYRYSDLYNELKSLKEENLRLRQFEWENRRKEEALTELRSLLNVPKDPDVEFVTGRVIFEGSGTFARSVLLNTGREQGVKNGFAIITANGLAGRIISSGRSSSRALLLSDPNSRIPVFVGRNQARAMLIGNNSELPHLEFLEEGSSLKNGDEVYSSGQGGLFPKGLRVGQVTIEGDLIHVKPYSDLEKLEFVTVLFYETPAVAAANRLEANYISKDIANQRKLQRNFKKP